jgi:hypothetical protein
VRVSYWLAPGQRVVLLTVFAKTRQHEQGEVERARPAQRACEQGHAAGTLVTGPPGRSTSGSGTDERQR